MNDYQASVTKEETIAPTISVNRIKENISGKYHSNDFFAIADEMNARYRAEGKVGTEALGKSVLNKFKSFVNSDTLQFDEITPNLLNKYQNFLITELGNKTNTVGKDLKYIGRVINKAISLDIINESINPFRKF
jgi:integrase/recombinase XerD